MKRIYTFLVIVVLSIGTAQAGDGYIPFVAKNKNWHVLGFSVGPYSSVSDYRFGSEEVVYGSHTYLNLYEINDKGEEHSIGLLREENRRVYIFDKATEQEYCAYDFTLEVGDMFDIGYGSMADHCIVTKVGKVNINGMNLKTITFSSIASYDDKEMFHEDHTWVEGIGSWGGPEEGWQPNTLASSWSYDLAFMTMPGHNPDFYPISFWDVWGTNNFIVGQELLKGEDLGFPNKWSDSLNYEIVGGRLHVFGNMCIQSGPNNYIYCKLTPTGKNATYEITLQKEGVEPISDGIYDYAVDLYFDIPLLKSGDNYDFVIVDQYGEHPISIHTGITKATSAVGKTGRRAYDLQGRPVSGKQRRGLYIRGGRVRVAK